MCLLFCDYQHWIYILLNKCRNAYHIQATSKSLVLLTSFYSRTETCLQVLCFDKCLSLVPNESSGTPGISPKSEVLAKFWSAFYLPIDWASCPFGTKWKQRRRYRPVHKKGKVPESFHNFMFYLYLSGYWVIYCQTAPGQKRGGIYFFTVGWWTQLELTLYQALCWVIIYIYIYTHTHTHIYIIHKLHIYIYIIHLYCHTYISHIYYIYTQIIYVCQLQIYWQINQPITKLFFLI